MAYGVAIAMIIVNVATPLSVVVTVIMLGGILVSNLLTRGRAASPVDPGD